MAEDQEVIIGDLDTVSGGSYHTVEVVQHREPDSIAIDKKELAGRKHGTVVSTVDAVWQYIEGLIQAKTTGYGGGEAEQKGIGGKDGQCADGGERPWLVELARIREILSVRMVSCLPKPNGPPGANFGPTADTQSTDLNGEMGDAGK